jgi:hypothetical protein
MTNKNSPENKTIAILDKEVIEADKEQENNLLAFFNQMANELTNNQEYA